jgi:hypothetical protein
VFSRQIDGQVLTLVHSGWIYNKTFVLYDRETGSLWYPSKDGFMGIQGEYFGRLLPENPSELVFWGTWKQRYPYSLILK